MSSTLIQAQDAMLIAKEAGEAMMLRSPSGYGKSSIAMKVFEIIREKNAAQGKTTGLGILFAATMTSPALIGLPWKGVKTWKLPVPDAQGREEVTMTVTDPSVPLWMLDVYTGKPASLFDDFVLIIEEYGQGDPETKRGLAEIFLNGGTEPFYLPPGSGRFACTNSGNRYGVTKDWLFAIARRTIIDIAPDINVLVDHWDKPYRRQGKTWQMSAIWKAWAKTAGQSIIFETEPEKDNPWCNPRTMSAADRLYQVMVKRNGGNDISPDDGLLIELFAGTIGMPATQSCIQHLQFRTQLPSYEDVVADPQGAICPAKGDLQMLMAYEMANQTQVESLPEALTYVQRLNQDMGLTYIAALLRRDYKGIINQPAMQAWIQKNSSVVAIVASLASS